jgi:ATP-dependent helicase/nuclease subunit B
MKLIYGRAGTGKTYYCMNEIKEEIAKAYKGPLLYIVPEQFSFEAEKELINIIGKSGIIKVEVLSFKRLAHRIFNELGFKGGNISNAGKSMLIFYILTKLDNKLKILKNSIKNTGIVDTVTDLISEFKRYNITPDLLKTINTKNEQLKIKLDDLYLIYDEYEKSINNRYIDTDDELTILSKLLNESKLYKDAKIWIDEFSGFTSQEYEVIRQLSKDAANISITITLDNNNEELFKLNIKTAKKLKKIEKSEEIYLKTNHRFMNNEIMHLEENIFKYPAKIYDYNIENIKINVCSNYYSEIERVAIEILKLVRENNLRYQNIAILARNLDTYKDNINMVFKLYNIPYFLDDKKELDSEPLIHLILSLLDICSNNFSYDSIFNYLKSGLTNIHDSNDIDIIENYVLKYGIRGNTWTKLWTIGNENLEKINIIRQQIINPIMSFRNILDTRKTAREIVLELYNFLINIGVYENIQNKINRLKEIKTTAAIETANEYTQVWNILIDLLDEIVDVIGDEFLSFEKFKNILKMGVTKHNIGLIPPSKDKVIIGNIDRTRNSNVKSLFIIGVNDGVFPMTFSTEGFINDDERLELLNDGIELAKDTKTLLFEENFNIYKALTTPSELLNISYSISTLDGKSLRPSYIIKQMKNIFPNLKESNYIINNENEFDYINTCDATFAHLLKKIRAYSDGVDINEIWKEAYEWYKTNYNDRTLSVISGLNYNNSTEYADKNSINNLYSSNMNVSVSKCEKFTLCPFSFYLRYGLNLKEREVYKLETPDIGSFLHQVIDKFSEYVQDNNIKWRELEKEWCNNKVDEIVNEILLSYKNNLFNSSSRLKYLGLKLKRILKRAIWLIVIHIKNSEFDVVGSEVEFGKGKQYKEIDIDLGNGNNLILNGKIDRIDIAKTEDGKFIRIIDYKSSNKEIKLSDVYYGLQLQLLTYLDAAANDDFIPGGVLYLKLDDPLIKSNRDITPEEIENQIMKSLRMDGLILSNARLIRAMDVNMKTESDIINLAIKRDGTYGKMPVADYDQFADLKKHIRNIYKEIGKEIMRGNVKNEPIRRKNKSACDFCEYKSICRFDRKLGNEYKYLNELKAEEVFSLINKEK